MTEELITETRIKLQNESVQAQEILKVFYCQAFAHGFRTAEETVDGWITAEKVDELYQEQR